MKDVSLVLTFYEPSYCSANLIDQEHIVLRDFLISIGSRIESGGVLWEFRPFNCRIEEVLIDRRAQFLL